MPKFRNFQTNFSGGLLSKGMLGRVDLAQYENGCKQLTNWWPKVTGGMRRRPGSLWLATIGVVASGEGRLESFVFSETQAYIVIFATGKWWVYDLDGAGIANGDTDYSVSEVDELSITQKGDVMLVAHPSGKTKKLTRTGFSSFTFTDFEFEGTGPTNAYPKFMPFAKFSQQEVTIQPNAYAKNANVVVTASEDSFDADLIGRAIRYRSKQIMVTAVNSPTELAGTILEELDQGAVLNFNSGAYKPHDFEVGEIVVGRDSGVKAEVVATGANSITVAMIAGRFASLTTEEVEGLTSGNIAKINANSNTNPPESADWDEEAFSDNRGWPGVTEFHSQRLWFGGSSSLPAHIFGSRVAAFFNFDVGDGFPADSIQVAIAGKQINLVTDIVSGRHLQVFTDKGEFYAPQSDDLPLIPETFDLIPQTRYGSKRKIEPKVFDESTIFVQSRGTAVREFIWQDTQKGYSADAISLISEDVIQSIREVEILYGGYDRPEQIAFFVNEDGRIAWYHSARAESIRTWGEWVTQGEYRSLTVIQDKLYALVLRTQNGVSINMLERFELNLTLDNSVSATDVTAKKIWPGLAPHFPNQAGLEAVVSSDVDDIKPDYYIGSYLTGNGGDLSLDIEVDNVTIGLGFKQTLETMPIEVKDKQGITTGMPKRVVYCDVYMESTLAIKANGNKVRTFSSENDLTVKPDPITGLRKFYNLGYSERPTVLIENEIPVPCEALSIGAEVEY